MAMFRFYRAWRRALARERVAARLAVAVAENWRARGVFLRLSDGELFEVALAWSRIFGAGLALDRVEAGREARAMATADLCLQALLAQGGNVLNLDGRPLWAVDPVFSGGGGAVCAAASSRAAAGGN